MGKHSRQQSPNKFSWKKIFVFSFECNWFLSYGSFIQLVNLGSCYDSLNRRKAINESIMTNASSLDRAFGGWWGLTSDSGQHPGFESRNIPDPSQEGLTLLVPKVEYWGKTRSISWFTSTMSLTMQDEWGLDVHKLGFELHLSQYCEIAEMPINLNVCKANNPTRNG